MYGVLVADLDGRDLQRLGPLPGIEERQLAVVAATHQQVGVLGVVLQAQHGGGGLQDLLRLVGVLWRMGLGRCVVWPFFFCRSGVMTPCSVPTMNLAGYAIC